VSDEIKPIGFVQAPRTQVEPFTAEALQGLADFSHVEVLFLFHQVQTSKIVVAARHPRNNADWPAVGIFAQRGKNRPNRIGSTMCPILRVEGTKLFVTELDAIDGTPVLDLKPVLEEFLPRQKVRQPSWSHELMLDYWRGKK
jgi:tRNA (adenine37-N6)-methyltransferase